MNIHKKDNNVQIDKYKIRVWIDKDVDASSWTKDTKQEYKFRIGVSSTDKEGTYNISYSPNGGEGQMAPSIYNENTEELLRKNTLTRGGYTFKGWSTTNNGEVEYQDQTKATNLTTGNDKNKTLYAVWQPNTYTVKYHSNGGLIKTTQTLEPDVNYDPLNFGDLNTKWTKEGNIYKSGSLSVDKPTYLFHSITLEAAGTLSFEVAVSQSEDYDGFVYGLASSGFSSLIMHELISATPGITKEDDLVYQKIEVPLEAGSYGLVVGEEDFSKTSEGLDRAYVKNIKISNFTEEQIEDSTFVVGQNNKLKKNQYQKKHYTFKGWDTNKNVSEPKYKDEKDLTEIEKKIKENEQIDLYAIWGKEKYTVNVVVQNGAVDIASKEILYDENGTFNLTTNLDEAIASVTCTNNQMGKVESNILTVSNITNNTTCTVTFKDTFTTLYEDGTLIINESTKNRNTNLSTHGNIMKEYEAMSDSNSYVFEHDPLYGSTSLWISEKEQIKSVEIGQKIEPISTAYWFRSLRNIEKGDFTNLDTSSVTNMNCMFMGVGSSRATTFNLEGLSNWNTSKVTDMGDMFYEAGYSATTWNIGDLSNWDTSKVTNMGSMFFSAGASATTWTVKIPSKTGDLTNTTSKWYGSSESVYVTPADGKSFTLAN